jgi:DNA modification methylase
VLDMFAGAGTTLVVAKKLGRAGIGIELNPKYAEMATKRIDETQAPLF